MTYFSGVTFVLCCFCFASFFVFVRSSLKPRPFVLSFFVMQAPRKPHVFLSFFPFVYLEMSLFPSFFFVPFPLSLCMKSTSYVISFRMVFFYFVTMGWIFYISLLCENSINQSRLCAEARNSIYMSLRETFKGEGSAATTTLLLKSR